MTQEHQHAGDATVQQMREGDFVDGESAGPYGGSEHDAAEGRPSATGEPAPAEHAAEQGAPDGTLGETSTPGEGDDGSSGTGDGGGSTGEGAGESEGGQTA